MQYEGQIHFAKREPDGSWKILWGPWAWWANFRSTGDLRKDVEKVCDLLLFEARQYNSEHTQGRDRLFDEAKGIMAFCDDWYAGKAQLPNKLIRYYEECGPKGWPKFMEKQRVAAARPSWMDDPKLDTSVEKPPMPKFEEDLDETIFK